MMTTTTIAHTTTITQTAADGQLETLEVSPWLAETLREYRVEYFAHETRAIQALERLDHALDRDQRPANVGPHQVDRIRALANLLEAAVGALPAGQ
jgi:hypothetical protein